jgi:hypothetical protein
MIRFAPLLGVLALAGACATPVAGPNAPAGSATIPTAAIALGDWRSASASSTLQEFSRTITQRYGPGLALTAVIADLRRNDFNCAEPPQGGRGSPPDFVCRHTVTANSCTHTWQVHVFDANGDGRLAESRGLYDRRCGSDGLLGGPG